MALGTSLLRLGGGQSRPRRQHPALWGATASCKEVEFGARHGCSGALPPHPLAPGITPASPWILPCDQWDRPSVPRGDRGDAGGHGWGTRRLRGTATELALPLLVCSGWLMGYPPPVPRGGERDTSSSITAQTHCGVGLEAGGGISCAKSRPRLASSPRRLAPPPALGLV